MLFTFCGGNLIPSKGGMQGTPPLTGFVSRPHLQPQTKVTSEGVTSNVLLSDFEEQDILGIPMVFAKDEHSPWKICPMKCPLKPILATSLWYAWGQPPLTFGESMLGWCPKLAKRRGCDRTLPGIFLGMVTKNNTFLASPDMLNLYQHGHIPSSLPL